MPPKIAQWTSYAADHDLDVGSKLASGGSLGFSSAFQPKPMQLQCIRSFGERRTSRTTSAGILIHLRRNHCLPPVEQREVKSRRYHAQKCSVA